MHFWLSLSCCLLLAFPLVGYTENCRELVEDFADGSINWTEGYLQAQRHAPFEIPSAANGRSEEDVLPHARRTSTHSLMETMARMRVDARSHMSDLMAADPRVAARAEELANSAAIVEAGVRPEEGAVVAVRLPIFGALAQLVLPESIKQMESIRSIHRTTGDTAGSSPLDRPVLPQEANVFSGLVVDARGTGARPAMAPVLVDENGKEVYGSAFVSREYAVQQGVCLYVGALDQPKRHPRVGPKPLLVKGLRTFGGRQCDIVISNADAAKLRDVSANLGFLRKCRVIIILDP